MPFHLQDYIALVDWTGRVIREGKRGAIQSDLPPILDHLDIEPQKWLILTTQFESRFKGLISGNIDKLKHAAKALGYKRTPGLSLNKAILC